MFARSPDAAFLRFKRTGDSAALAKVFDRTAKELLRVARHLGGAEAAAEDLLQATFVTAIEARATHEDGRPVLPWLIGILANHARCERRRGRRRVDPERLQKAGVVDAAEAAASRELRDVLGATVDRLAEPYRPVLRLYLEHGLEPIEVAHALERPPGTVRAQLARGLELLRRALPAGVGAAAAMAAAPPARGLGSVREAVLRAAGSGEQAAVVTTAASTLGVLAMIKTPILTVSAAAAAIALLVLGWPGGGDRTDAADARATNPPVLRTAAAPNPSAEDEGAAPRTPAPSTPATATAAEVSAATGPPELEVRILYRGAVPLAGAVLVLTEVSSTQDPLAGVRAVTDEKGRAVFRGLPPRMYLVHLARTGVLRAVTAPAAGRREEAIMVKRGLDLTGVVVDADGLPVAGARVLVHGDRLEPAELCRTGADGRFTAADLGPGVAVQAEGDGHRSSLAHPLRGEPGDALTVELHLRRGGRTVRGVVRDDAGRPVPEALVAVAGGSAPAADAPHERGAMVRADGEGRYVLRGVAPTEQLLVASPPQREGGLAPAPATLAAGADDAVVDIHLQRGASLSGQVVAHGEPQRGVSVTAFAEQPEEGIGHLVNLLGFAAAVTDRDGRYLLRGLLPGGHQVSAHGRGLDCTQRLQLAAGEVAVWDPFLDRGVDLELRIEPRMPPTGATGIPMWFATLHRAEPGPDVDSFVAFQPVAPDGSVVFRSLPPTPHLLTVLCRPEGGPGDQITVYRERLLPSAQPRTVRIADERLPTASVTARLVDHTGQPVPGAELRLLSVDGGGTQTRARADDSGRTLVGPVPPGRYQVLGVSPPREIDLVREEQRQLGDLEIAGSDERR